MYEFHLYSGCEHWSSHPPSHPQLLSAAHRHIKGIGSSLILYQPRGSFNRQSCTHNHLEPCRYTGSRTGDQPRQSPRQKRDHGKPTVVAPVHPIPPHWAYCAAPVLAVVVVVALVVVVAKVELGLVAVVVGLDSCSCMSVYQTLIRYFFQSNHFNSRSMLWRKHLQ